MKFHAPSFLVGLGVASAVVSARHRLRPIVVELGALGLNLAHAGRAILERQVEHAEDLWAEIEERVHLEERGLRRRAKKAGPSTARRRAPEPN